MRCARVPRDRALRFVSLEEFGRGEGVYCLHYEWCDPPDVTLQRARNELGAGSLDLFHIRCEQFASWCKTGNAPNAPRPTRPPLLA